MLTRVWSVLRRIADIFPLTPLGLAVTLGSYGILQRFGYRQRDLVLFALGALGLVLLAVALVISTVGAFLSWRAARRATSDMGTSLECDRAAPTGFSVPSLWFLPFVTIAWSWRGLTVDVRQVRRSGRIFEIVRPLRRGVSTTLERRFEVGDAFGLVRYAFAAVEPRETRLLPAVGSLRQVSVIRGLSAGSDVSDIDGRPEGDPFDTRRYAPGDPIRFVLWKVFAKSRTLIVRTPERAVSPTEHTVAYLVAGRDDEAAAGAARVALDIGAFGNEWRLGADGHLGQVHSREQALALITDSANVGEQDSGAGLARFVDEAGALGRLVVFVPPRPGPWLARVGRAVRELKGRVDFVIGTDGIARGSAMRRALLRDEADGGGGDAVPIDELRQVVTSLAGGTHGARVVVVDRRSGQVYSPEHLVATKSRGTGAAA